MILRQFSPTYLGRSPLDAKEPPTHELLDDDDNVSPFAQI